MMICYLEKQKDRFIQILTDRNPWMSTVIREKTKNVEYKFRDIMMKCLTHRNLNNYIYPTEENSHTTLLVIYKTYPVYI